MTVIMFLLLLFIFPRFFLFDNYLTSNFYYLSNRNKRFFPSVRFNESQFIFAIARWHLLKYTMTLGIDNSVTNADKHVQYSCIIRPLEGAIFPGLLLLLPLLLLLHYFLFFSIKFVLLWCRDTLRKRKIWPYFPAPPFFHHHSC